MIIALHGKMTDLNTSNFNELREFFKWRKENPKDYGDFLKDYKELFKDLHKIMKEVFE